MYGTAFSINLQHALCWKKQKHNNPFFSKTCLICNTFSFDNFTPSLHINCHHVIMILLKAENYEIEVTKTEITEASSDFFFSHCHKYLMNQSQSWIGQQQQSLPECIYNPIMPMGFWVMFAFQLDNTKR